MHIPVALLVAAITVASAHAGSRNFIFVRAGLSSEITAGWAAPDVAEEPPVLIATGDFNRDGIADMVETTFPQGKDSSQPFLTVLLGQADGTFKSVASHNIIGSDPRELIVGDFNGDRSEEHTSELQSLRHLVCRLLL